MAHQFTGKVRSGTGRGAKFISIPIYTRIFEKLLGVTPFPGTLNLKLDKEAAEAVDESFQNGQVFDNLEYEGQEYGGIITIPIEVGLNGDNLDAVAVRPHLTSHDTDIVELVAAKHLRAKLDLKDGDEVQFSLIENNN